MKNIVKKDKHKFPDTDDTFASKVKRAYREKRHMGILYGPDNLPISRVDTEASTELDGRRVRRIRGFRRPAGDRF